MVDIVFVRSVIYDTTIVKSMRSLSKIYSAVFLAWNREGIDKDTREDMFKKTFPSESRLQSEILDKRAPHGKHLLLEYLPMIVYFPYFWFWVFVRLVVHRPEVVHAFDLDAILPCYIYKKLFQKKLVFHIVDRYAMTFIPKKFQTLYSIVNWFEEQFSKGSDLLITVSENVLKSFKHKPKSTAAILNCLEDYRRDNKEIKNDTALVLGYSGPIIKGRGLDDIAEVLKNVEDVKLYIYGPVIDKKLFTNITKLKNIEYKGYLRIFDDYHKAIISTDVIIAIYTTETPSHHVTMHNKTLEAMMGGIPIVTNLSPELVRDIGFGIVVEYGNQDQIKSAIISLRDNTELRIKLGNNGRKAYLEKYNWAIMEKELYDVYENLIKK